MHYECRLIHKYVGAVLSLTGDVAGLRFFLSEKLVLAFQLKEIFKC